MASNYIDVQIAPFKEQLSVNDVFTEEDYKVFVKTFKEGNYIRFKALKEYRDGLSIIDTKEMNTELTPNHKVKANFCKMISDTAVGYFMGIGLEWTTEDEEVEIVVDAINSSNDSKTHDYEMAMNSSIYGVSYELYWRDEEAHFRFNACSPLETFVVRKSNMEKTPLLGFRVIEIDEKNTQIEVYTDNEKIVYLAKGDDWAIQTQEVNTFQQMQIVENFNNLFKTGDFEPALTLIEAYNVSLSNTSNDIETFTDAFLVLKGYEDTRTEDLKEVLGEKVFSLTENGSVEFLTKSTNDTQHENYRNRLVKNIHEVTHIPNLTSDEFVSSISGIALRLKMQSLDQLTAEKEMFYRKTLKQRLTAITEHMMLLNKVSTKDIKVDSSDYVTITFTKNIPVNLVELSDMVSKLSLIVSEETLLNQLPFIDDAKTEMERKNEEMKQEIAPSGAFAKEGVISAKEEETD
jgi:SPP1 family phage portal protein